jgi:hypothetical protein
MRCAEGANILCTVRTVSRPSPHRDCTIDVVKARPCSQASLQSDLIQHAFRTNRCPPLYRRRPLFRSCCLGSLRHGRDQSTNNLSSAMIPGMRGLWWHRGRADACGNSALKTEVCFSLLSRWRILIDSRRILADLCACCQRYRCCSRLRSSLMCFMRGERSSNGHDGWHYAD